MTLRVQINQKRNYRHFVNNSRVFFAGPDQICSFVIGDACGDVYNPYHEWEVMFPPVPKPKIDEQNVPLVLINKKKSSRCR